jgi:primosomal protein N' (replication factor Y)
VQTRRPGIAWQSSFRLGWERFWKDELRERKSLNLPPYSLLVQVNSPKNEKNSLKLSLEKAGFFAMDAGDENAPLWITAKSTERLGAILAPYFEIKHSRKGFPAVTVWTE